MSIALHDTQPLNLKKSRKTNKGVKGILIRNIMLSGGMTGICESKELCGYCVVIVWLLCGASSQLDRQNLDKAILQIVECFASIAFLALHNLLGRAFGYDISAHVAALFAKVDDMIC